MQNQLHKFIQNFAPKGDRELAIRLLALAVVWSAGLFFVDHLFGVYKLAGLPMDAHDFKSAWIELMPLYLAIVLLSRFLQRRETVDAL